MPPTLTLVLARAQNGVIGVRGRIPWRIAADMKRFKAITLGKPVAMGRKTWDSLPRKPLPGRANIVITRDPAWRADGALGAASLEDAIAKAGAADDIAVIGGAEIYALALPCAHAIELTEVHADFDGDARMAPFGPQWREVAREDGATAEGLKYSFVRLERRPPSA
ncbi:MAG TPA: dihydrofolate reductase [Rhizomicrobium sp.]|nr:dihydrofolate reductase [Rhizomicrobium sp.]